MLNTRGWAHVGTGVAIGAMGLAMIGGVSYAAPSDIPDNSGEIKLCFNKSDAKHDDGGAVLSIFDPEHNKKKCAKGDRKIEINQEGPQGETGPQGIPGPAGPPSLIPGPVGPQGPSAVPVTGYAAGSGLLSLGQDQQPTAYFPQGIISALVPGAFATAPIALSLTNFVLHGPAGGTDIADGVVFKIAVNGTAVASCTVAADTCTIAGPVALAAGDTYQLIVPADDDPDGDGTLVNDGNNSNSGTALRNGSSFSYTLVPA